MQLRGAKAAERPEPHASAPVSYAFSKGLTRDPPNGWNLKVDPAEDLGGAPSAMVGATGIEPVTPCV